MIASNWFSDVKFGEEVKEKILSYVTLNKEQTTTTFGI